MGISEFAKTIPERGVHASIGEFRVGMRRRNGWLEERSTHVFDRDWDVLVILDACRTDLLDSVSEEYEFLGTQSETIYSVGGTSPEWIDRTFGPLPAETLEETAYVTGNPHSARADINHDAFGLLDEVWRDRWDDDIGGIRPRALTDRTIAAMRSQDFDRVIVHYMQPHIPFLGDQDLSRAMDAPDAQTFGDPSEKTVWDRLREQEVSRADVWDAYQDNLRRVLNDVVLLRENVTADRMVISADHGNAMGELGQWGHGRNCRVDSVCKVPWEVTTATDQQTYTPDLGLTESSSSGSVEDRLEALGYR